MELSIRIEEFNALLKREQQTSKLLSAVRELMSRANLEDFLTSAFGPDYAWFGWN